MARGYPQTPRWAWFAMVVAAVGVVVLGTITATRGNSDPMPKAERDRLAAAASAAAASDVAEASAAAVAPTASQPIALQRPDGDPMRVLFAGDSITAGAFALTDPETFRGRVVDALDDDGDVDWTRIGNSGLTTSEVFPEVATAGEGYGLVVVELGTNDVLRSTASAFREDYPRFLDAVREHSPQAALLCVGVWGEDSSQVRTMNHEVKAECEARAGGYVPVDAFYADQANRGPAGTVRPSDKAVLDDFHPNNAGHAAIAQAILAGLAING